MVSTISNEEILVTSFPFDYRSFTGPVLSFSQIVERLRSPKRSFFTNPSLMFLDPRNAQEVAICKRLLEKKLRNDLAHVKFVFCSWKGVRLLVPRYLPVVEKWWVDSRSVEQYAPAEKLFFSPLTVSIPKDVTVGSSDYVFCGGNKWRAPEKAYEAALQSGLPALFIDPKRRIKTRPSSNVIVLRNFVPYPWYCRLMNHSRLVLLPLEQGHIPHGQTDAATARALGKPILATRGASVDDYVRHNIDGLLMDSLSITEIHKGLLHGWEMSEDFAENSKQIASEFRKTDGTNLLNALSHAIDS